MSIQDDKELLVQFIRDTYEWVGVSHQNQWYATDSGWPSVRPLGFLRGDAEGAWHEFTQTQPEEGFVHAIQELEEHRLIANGLFGEQLRYKLSLLRYLARRALNGGRRANQTFVNFLEILLDSLLEILGVGEALKELVGALKAQLK
jgi:hypothetical protein